MSNSFATPWTVAHQAPLSVEFSQQEYWSGLPFPISGDHPDPGIEPVSLACPALAGKSFTSSAAWEAHSASLPTLYSVDALLLLPLSLKCALQGQGL